MKRSHVQLSKGHMKPFSSLIENDYMTFKLDLDSRTISLENIKFIDTVYGFYSDFIEDEMNRKYENKFFSLKNLLINVIEKEGASKVRFGKNEQNIIIEYLNLAILRSQKTVDSVNDKSLAAIIVGGFSNNDLMKAKLSGNLSEKIFGDYSALIIKNDTEINFVLPASSYYYSPKINKEFTETEFNLFIPISPKLAYMLLLKSDFDSFNKNHGFSYLIMNNATDIEFLNERAYRSEVHGNRKFIVSKTRQELEKLVLVQI